MKRHFWCEGSDPLYIPRPCVEKGEKHYNYKCSFAFSISFLSKSYVEVSFSLFPARSRSPNPSKPLSQRKLRRTRSVAHATLLLAPRFFRSRSKLNPLLFFRFLLFLIGFQMVFMDTFRMGI